MQCYALLGRATLNTLLPQPVLILGAVLTQSHVLKLGLAEFFLG